MKQLLVIVFFSFVIGTALGQDTPPNDTLTDQRTDKISKTLRCVVCQNQSIYDSDAPLAQDMRRLVKKRVEAGDSDAEVRAYLRQRYGDYVLLTPPFQSNTWLLWLGPLVLVLALLAWFWRRTRRDGAAMRQTPTAPLSDAARARVAAALKSDQDALE